MYLIRVKLSLFHVFVDLLWFLPYINPSLACTKKQSVCFIFFSYLRNFPLSMLFIPICKPLAHDNSDVWGGWVYILFYLVTDSIIQVYSCGHFEAWIRWLMVNLFLNISLLTIELLICCPKQEYFYKPKEKEIKLFNPI